MPTRPQAVSISMIERKAPWLVDARRIEQRRITEREGRDANVAYG